MSEVGEQFLAQPVDQGERVSAFGSEIGVYCVGAAARGQGGQLKKGAPTRTDVPNETAPPRSERGEELKAELDDLLDEIDEVLEENAEEFVRSYVQKGGQ